MNESLKQNCILKEQQESRPLPGASIDKDGASALHNGVCFQLSFSPAPLSFHFAQDPPNTNFSFRVTNKLFHLVGI